MDSGALEALVNCLEEFDPSVKAGGKSWGRRVGEEIPPTPMENGKGGGETFGGKTLETLQNLCCLGSHRVLVSMTMTSRSCF